MAKDFFDGLGESFAKTMREIGGRAESFYSEQKLRNRISSEEKQIQKIMEELGKVIYRRYRDGVPLEDMQKRLCEQIDQRMDKISQYKEEIAGVKSKKVCPSCGTAVDAEVSFCPHCGAACITREPEEQAGDVAAEGTAFEVTPEAPEAADVETENSVEETTEAEESTEAASETVGEMAEPEDSAEIASETVEEAAAPETDNTEAAPAAEVPEESVSEEKVN